MQTTLRTSLSVAGLVAALAITACGSAETTAPVPLPQVVTAPKAIANKAGSNSLIKTLKQSGRVSTAPAVASTICN